MTWHIGSLRVSTGRVDEAAEHLSKARQLYSPSEYLDQGLIAFDEATCLLQQEDVTSACGVAVRVLTQTPEEHRTGILINRAGEIVDALPLARRSLPQARELREVVIDLASAEAHTPGTSG